MEFWPQFVIGSSLFTRLGAGVQRFWSGKDNGYQLFARVIVDCGCHWILYMGGFYDTLLSRL